MRSLTHQDFLNYELSWLKFNWRVLNEAKREENPLLERVRFISIVCSNLDEFFQKRVGGLKRQQMAGVTHLSVDGKTPEEQLALVRDEVIHMMDDYRTHFFDTLVPALKKEGVEFRLCKDLTPTQKEVADRYFEQKLFPLIIPLAVDEAHPFPFISNKSRSFALKLEHPDTGEQLFARIKIPTNRPRWIRIEEDGKTLLVATSDIIRSHLSRLFPGMNVLAAHIFRVTRNADLERNEEEAEDLLELIEEELRERRFAETVRMELDEATPAEVRKFLKKELNVKEQDIYDIKGSIGLADVMELANIPGFDHLRFQPWAPAAHPVLRLEADEESSEDIFKAIRRGFIVHHPYQSFASTTQKFVEAAAADPTVLAIKQTLYRTSSDSQIMHALIRAAEAGKQVAVLVELKARFDEQQNITWAHKLENAGVHVSYGIAGLKIHSKLTLVVREEGDSLQRYVHIGTGNYHPKTAQLYEDFGFFTCDEEITSDVTDLFNMLTGYAPSQSYRQLLVAPKYMRTEIVRLIDREISNGVQGKPARIIGKMNNLEDPELIAKLYEASEAGVEIDLIVRSVCRLIPGVKGLSERIRVRSIVGRFLEHSRCYYFENGGNGEYFIGSADWMHRNLDARVEAITPIRDKRLKDDLAFVLNLYLKDNQQSWSLDSTGEYHKADPNEGEPGVCVQQTLMDKAKQTTIRTEPGAPHTTDDKAPPEPTSLSWLHELIQRFSSR